MKANGRTRRHDDEELLARIVSVINNHERCLSQEELQAEAKTTHKTLLARSWSMDFLYRAAGRVYEGPHLYSRFEDRVFTVLSEIVPDDMEIEPNKTLPGMNGFKGGDLRADFYVQDLNLIVEADGDQHFHGRGDLDNLDYILANDRLKDQYAATNGINLIRIPETADTRSIKAQLIRGIRRARPRFRPLVPSNTPGGSHTTRRMPKRREVSRLPKLKKGEKGEPLHDVYCRGCHQRPSYMNGNSPYCASCWDRWNEVKRSTRVLEASDAQAFKEELTSFVKSRGRYVWPPEVTMYLRPIAGADLKKHGIKVSRICRELGLYPPQDDRLVANHAQRVQDFVKNYMAANGKLPGVKEVVTGANLDYDTLWSCMDYEAYIAGLGGKIPTVIRHRFADAEEFLQAAIEVVKKAGRWLKMTEIVDGLGISYPAYLSNFKSVRSEEIHEKAGFSKPTTHPGQQ